MPPRVYIYILHGDELICCEGWLIRTFVTKMNTDLGIWFSPFKPANPSDYTAKMLDEVICAPYGEVRSRDNMTTLEEATWMESRDDAEARKWLYNHAYDKVKLLKVYEHFCNVAMSGKVRNI